jgi:hypothetical protein
MCVIYQLDNSLPADKGRMQCVTEKRRLLSSSLRSHITNIATISHTTNFVTISHKDIITIYHPVAHE